MKKVLLLISLISMLFYTSCDDRFPWHEGESHKPVKKYSGDLAVKWMKLQMTISRTTPGFNPGLATRAFAYSGLSLVRIYSRGNARI